MAGNLFSKTIGLVALGLTAYDVCSTTKLQASRSAKYAKLQRIGDAYLRTDSLDSESVLANDLQNWSRSWHMSDNWFYRMGDSITSYISHFANNFGDNIGNIALGTVALLSGKGRFSPIKFPILGKIAAGVLAVKAGIYVLNGLFGIFDLKDRNKNNI